MNPERYRQIGELYHAALEISSAERAAFLTRECGDDEDLRKEVESLVNSHQQAGGFIEKSALNVAAEMLADRNNNTFTGEMVSHYRVVSMVGAGGMGRVYSAEDTTLGRRVALKLLTESFTSDKNQMQRFHQEARAASALNHPNILTVYEVGQWRGQNFIATEFVEGITLRTRMRRRLSLVSAIDIALQIAGALAAAHVAGIVHRDIKPENVMIRPDGLVKILDFGVAKYVEPPREAQSWIKTATGVVIGTTAYMSPEQARGQEVDARTDIWSLGVILYEMVARRLPFPGKTPTDRVAAILEREPSPVSKHRVPAELTEIIGRALAKDKSTRYARVTDMANDLRRVRSTLDEERMLRFALPALSNGLTSFRNRRLLTLATLLLLMVAFAAGYILLKRRAQPNTATLSATMDSIAVLPLENLSGDASQEYFADGMTDALIGDLAKIKGLHVISRTSAMHYKGTNKPLREIADELKVDVVVEGTVQRSGDRVMVRAQLIEAATDRHIWAEVYERDLRDVLALQSEIAQAVVRQIQIKLLPAEQARLATRRQVNRKAFDDYLQGRYLYFNRHTDENLHRAISFYESAIKEDPEYALAYVGLAECYNSLGSEQIGALPPQEARRLTEDAARKALAIDNQLAEAHVALALVKLFEWEWEAAEQEFRFAIELDPNNALGHLRYATLLVSQGRMSEGIGEANRAQELDPFSLSMNALRGFLLENARRYDEAIEQLHRVISMDQNNYQAYWYLGHTYAANGRFQEAVAASEKAVAISRTPGALGFLGMNYGLAGRKADAMKILNELMELRRHRYVTPPALANVHIGLGNKDQAFYWLEKGYEDKSNYLTWLKVFPAVDPLRSDPRCDELLRRIGLTR